jgi:hypothetical protein
MDRGVRDYLIRAHNKVLAHYRQVLQGTSLSAAERDQVQKRLADAEAEFASFSSSSPAGSRLRMESSAAGAVRQ